jgi:hypothetical protein
MILSKNQKHPNDEKNSFRVNFEHFLPCSVFYEKALKKLFLFSKELKLMFKFALKFAH